MSATNFVMLHAAFLHRKFIKKSCFGCGESALNLPRTADSDTFVNFEEIYISQVIEIGLALFYNVKRLSGMVSLTFDYLTLKKPGPCQLF